MAIQKKLKEKTRNFIDSKHMLSGITVASFLESTIVPIPLEAVLVPLMQALRYFGLAIIVYYAGNEAERIISKHKTKAMVLITLLVLGVWGLSLVI